MKIEIGDPAIDKNDIEGEVVAILKNGFVVIRWRTGNYSEWPPEYILYVHR